MADLVVDTDVVSFGFRQDARFLNAYGPAIQGHRLVISFMTVAELQFGALNRGWGVSRREELQHYLERHYVRYFATESMCNVWAELIWKCKEQGRVLNSADAWIAATAVVLSIPLVTHNAKDFRHVPGLKLITFEDQ